MQKIWQKDKASLKEVETFTVGQDRELDLLLAPYDVLGSIAHVTMLGSVGLLEAGEARLLVDKLREIHILVSDAGFILEEGAEDIHSQVEAMLTRMLGDAGKKIHSARSRNDQVLVDLKLFLRAELGKLIGEVRTFFDLLQEKSETFKDHLLPEGIRICNWRCRPPSGCGSGRMRRAWWMISSRLRAAYAVVSHKNPLGSAAGYGSSFPIDRTQTTQLLGF